MLSTTTSMTRFMKGLSSMNEVTKFTPKNKEDLLKLARMHVAQSHILEQRIQSDMKELEELTQRAIKILNELSDEERTSS